MNIGLIKEAVKIGTGFAVSIGIDKIVKMGIEHIAPDKVLTKCEKIIMTVGTTGITMALSSIVSSEIEKDIDYIFDIPNKIEKAKDVTEKDFKDSIESESLITDYVEVTCKNEE